MKKRYVDWKELTGHVQEIARKITLSGWKPDIIVGITRGGAIPAVMLSQYFNCKMVGLDVSLRDHTNYPWTSGPEVNCWLPEDASNGCKILIVDDINDSGATLNWIHKDWSSSMGNIELPWNQGIRTAVIFDKPTSKFELLVDYFGEEIDADMCDQWIVFPYEEFWK
jgi:uncharacterized protein